MHTANLLTLIANCNRSPKRSRPFQLADFLPPDIARLVRRSTGTRLTTKVLHAMKSLFTGTKQP